MIDFSLRPEALKVSGKVESLYVYFRNDVRIKESLRFTLNEAGRVMVYVGEDDLPVALQFVDPLPDHPERAVERDSPPMNLGIAHALLFGLASKMIAFHEAGRQGLGNNLIRDAVSHILQNDGGACCAPNS